jgi:hypothetical protein
MRQAHKVCVALGREKRSFMQGAARMRLPTHSPRTNQACALVANASAEILELYGRYKGRSDGALTLNGSFIRRTVLRMLRS